VARRRDARGSGATASAEQLVRVAWRPSALPSARCALTGSSRLHRACLRL
jgi:hypothetical protein